MLLSLIDLLNYHLNIFSFSFLLIYFFVLIKIFLNFNLFILRLLFIMIYLPKYLRLSCSSWKRIKFNLALSLLMIFKILI